MKTLAAYTGPTPATGYVGYINISQSDEGVRIIVRPESDDCSGTASLVIPPNEALSVFGAALEALEKNDDA